MTRGYEKKESISKLGKIAITELIVEAPLLTSRDVS